MPSSKAIQIILARHLASSVAMPIMLLDADGTLIYYNESAEAIINQRFDETGEIPSDEWNRMFTVEDEDRNPISADERPMRSALMQRRPISRTIWTRHAGGEWQHLQVTAFPLVGERQQLLGVMNIFWEI